ncbi:MAG: MqnA/MqnD/SBP family protein [Armatimonadota bacterium]|nr:MqnA/MqnD/SBP family protein [Armatimonadota bacterium]
MLQPVTIHLAHSPDADDAFMFYALAKELIDTEGLHFEHILRDIQTLNEWAREGRMEVTALSVHAYAYVRDRYAILISGASMGDGYGPLIVSAEPLSPKDLREVTIAVPGLLTSAYLALKLYLPEAQTVVMPFDQILPAVQQKATLAGLLIHEGQLTHREAGVYSVVDLGAWWKEQTGLPLPLGVNAVRRDLPRDVQQRIARILRRSIEYSLQHRQEALQYALDFGRGIGQEVADRFVGMYVNEWTVDMGEAGKEAIRLFLARGAEAGIIPPVGEVEFIE